jgi:hypothetical protein
MAPGRRGLSARIPGSRRRNGSYRPARPGNPPGEIGVLNSLPTPLDRDGREQARSPDHRATFQGGARRRRWSLLDAACFFGYAVTHYHALPFTLPEGRLLHHRGDVLTVELPASLHTHSRQTFHFGGLIRRHDYVADIVGWWARGTHLWCDYTTVDGFPVARTRHVVARLGGLPLLPFVALHADLVPFWRRSELLS